MSVRKPAKVKWTPYRVYLDVFCDACGHASAEGERGGVALCAACGPRMTDADIAGIREMRDALERP